MQGQKVVKKTMLTLFKGMLFLCLFMVVCYISYRLTLAFSSESNGNSSTNPSSDNAIVSAKADAVALNLVFGVDKDTAEVQSIVLEIFNTSTKNIDLVTIPASMKVTMSQELYSKLSATNANIPQIITLSKLGQYFDQDEAYAYGTLILNEFLNTDISFYSALLKKDFDEYFTEKSNMYTFKDSAVSTWKGYTKSEDYLDALIDYYGKVQSNLKLADRKTYITSYLSANYKFIHTYLMNEDYVDGKYILKSEDAELLRGILNNGTTYLSSANATAPTASPNAGVASSKGLKIQILNSTSKAGLAATFKQKLEGMGYTISAVGNYTAGGALTTTKIIVKESGLGTDLKQYFTSPVMETKTIEGGYDILIILGSKDA